MTNDGRELAQIQEQIAAQLERAVRMQRAVEPPEAASARSADGDVETTVDERGLLADVRFAPSIADLEAEELAALVMTTLREARTRRGPAPVRADAASDLHDDTLSRRILELVAGQGGPAGEKGEARA